MRTFTASIAIALTLWSARLCPAADPPREFDLNWRVLEKPSPDHQEETVIGKTVRVVIAEEIPCDYMVGHHVPGMLYPFDRCHGVGYAVCGIAGKAQNGRVPIDLTIQLADLAEQAGETTQLVGQVTRIISAVTLGNPTRFPWKDGVTGRHRIVEVTLADHVGPSVYSASGADGQKTASQRTDLADDAPRNRRRRR